ncbi:alpha/beta hydrolase [Planomonospora sp. ID91781]|uniref:alpha/beta hydrolase n=1 Tax=Planomonospora sp. ID91781 TaxID=2738135 RepID=UPI0018C3ED33|nr:alpha/beta hydrolase [Planomonospora sp. ID91781]MBG0826025.1 alpha/beta hydrolase [Planomonospora sp. ID91781]
MPEARLHDGSVIEIEVHGTGPALLLPVDPRPAAGERAEELRSWGMDPALGRSLVEGLGDVFRVVAFDYEGHVMAAPKPGTLTPDAVAADLLAVADAVGADRFAYYGYSWLALSGLQLAVRTGRLWALAMGGFPPLAGPYAEMLKVTEATHELAVAAGAPPESRESPSPRASGDGTESGRASGDGTESESASGDPARDGRALEEPARDAEGTGDAGDAGDLDWSTIEVTLTEPQTRQFVTLYRALQDFDDRTAQPRVTCPRLCFVGSADEISYGERWGGVRVSLAAPVIDRRAELEALGWDVRVLDGLDHTQAMQPARVLPILRPWLLSRTGR